MSHETGQIQYDNFANGLSEVFQTCGLDLSRCIKKGVLALDVGYGREITSFSPFNPRPFIVTEPDSVSEDPPERWKRLLSGHLIEHPEVQLLRMDAIAALEKLKDESQRLGLITRLNIFPPRLTYHQTTAYFTAAAPLLVPGGVAVLSFDQLDDEFGTQAYRAFYHTRSSLPGVRFHDPEPCNPNEVGGLFLMIEKMSDK